MQFEAIKPAHAAFAPSCESSKDFVRGNAAAMAHPNRQAVDELQPAGLAFARLHVGTERKQCCRNQFHKTGVAGKSGEFSPPLQEHVGEIKMLKRAIVRDMKEDQDGQDLTEC
jgi:hypothetical protein